MENLEVVSKSIIDLKPDYNGNPLVCDLEEDVCSFYTDKKRLLFYKYNGEDYRCIVEEHQDIGEIKHLKYLPQTQLLFFATDYDLMIYNPASENICKLLSLPKEILSVSWNPYETVLIVIDTENILHHFELRHNTSNIKNHLDYELHQSSTTSSLDDAVPNSVYVGWGSHNTQFKGSKKIQEVVKEFPIEYNRPIISWRGNGEQFVVNFWRDAKRFVKVFDASLEPLYESSPYPNLQKPTSFKGEGNFIASVAGTKCGDKPYQKIVIFEKNCLVKSEFVVPENKGEINNILYHPGENLLAVCSLEEGSSYLNVYYRSNNHFYLKQQFLFPKEEVKYFNWIYNFTKSVIRLDIVTAKAVHVIYLRYIINRLTNSSIVSVVDGKCVYFIDYSQNILPPPTFGDGEECHIIWADTPVNKIISHPTKRNVTCVDSMKRLYSFQFLCDKMEQIGADIGSFDARILNDPKQYLEFNDSNETLEPFYLCDPDNANIIYCTAFKIGENIYQFAVDRKQDLLINKSVMCSNVSSLYIYGNYLLITHASSKLYCIRLTLDNVNQSAWRLNEFYCRDIEQGAKIVCVTKFADIVLLLPRGNLETIFLRLIAIDFVEKLLSEDDWFGAVDVITTKKLNFNLVIDLNPERFLKNVEKFLDAVEPVSLLNQAVTEISENCVEPTYLRYLEESKMVPNSICDRRAALYEIINYVKEIDPVSNLVAIVNVHAKHFSLQGALEFICSLFDSKDFVLEKKEETCRKAVSQILLYCNKQDVIRTSFSLCNIEFMNFIFTCCSADPRSYQPKLEKLRSCPDPVKVCFEMKNDAKDYKGATQFLVNMTIESNFVKDFIIKNETEDEAYKNVKHSSPHFGLCSKLFAKKLSDKKKHDEAGFILYRAEMLVDALDEFILALNAPKVFIAISKLKLQESEKKEKLLKLANAFVNHKRIDEAVNLYEHDLQDIEKAIDVLVENNMYQKALCMAVKYNRFNIIDAKIKPEFVKYRTDLQDKITNLKKTFSSYNERLDDIRVKRLFRLRMEQPDTMPDDDLLSEYGSVLSSRASTVSSSRSKMSTMSSKQRRKQEKKKLDLKEGGVFEDIALIRHLHGLIIEISACGPEVREMCLTAFNDLENIEPFQKVYNDLCELQAEVNSELPLIWPQEFINDINDSTDIAVLNLNWNREHLDEKYRRPPFEKLDESWKVPIF